CQSYTFPDYECFLLGSTYVDKTTCILPYYEWVKKTSDEDCPDTIAQPAIDYGCVKNPALALAAEVDSSIIRMNKFSPCRKNTILDLTLPDNRNTVE
ncbi:hypothetical protein PMAYCL1PPCAC_04618, partial [Pristionchus mayeri]